MRIGKALWIAAALMIAAAGTAHSATVQAPRIGLVIGNAVYSKAEDALPGARRDAARIKEALEHVGFQVTLLQNATRSQIEKAVTDFRAALRAGGPQSLGFIYFAGHGGADAGRLDNYILPSDVADVASADVAQQGIGVRWITEQLAYLDERAAIVVVIDACRTATQRARGMRTPDLVEPDEQKPGFLVALSTSKELPASDAGQYAESLAAKLQESGLTLDQVFEQVRQQVAQKTRQNQIPTERSKLVAKVCFVSCASDDELRQQMRCMSATLEALGLALQAGNAERSVELLICKHDLLADRRTRSLIAQMFATEQFRQRLPLLTALRTKGGVDFVTDFSVRAEAYFPEYVYATPLGQAVETASTDGEPLTWLLRGFGHTDLARYPGLAGLLVERLLEASRNGSLPKLKNPVFELPPTWNRDLHTLTQLREAALPVDANDYQAFQKALTRWLEVQWVRPEYASTMSIMERQWMQQYAPYANVNFDMYADRRWAAPLSSLMDAVAPSDAKVRESLQQRVTFEFQEPRLVQLDQQIKRYDDALARPIVGMKELRPVEKSARLLRDDDSLQLDPNDPSRTYLVKDVRAKLAELRVRRAELVKLSQLRP